MNTGTVPGTYGPRPGGVDSPEEATQRGREAPGVTRAVWTQPGPPRGPGKHAPTAGRRTLFLKPRQYEYAQSRNCKEHENARLKLML